MEKTVTFIAENKKRELLEALKEENGPVFPDLVLEDKEETDLVNPVPQ